MSLIGCPTISSRTIPHLLKTPYRQILCSVRVGKNFYDTTMLRCWDHIKKYKWEWGRVETTVA